MEKRIDLLNSGSRYLSSKGVANPLCESEIFLAHTLNCPRAELYLDNLSVGENKLWHFWNLLTARTDGFPLQYILGATEFMGLEFKVGPGVFIPRPETEILVETALNLLPTAYHLPPNILDIGTGCGNIAISIAKYLKKAHIFACDISDSALQLAKENSRLNNATICLVKSYLFCAFKRQDCFSLIISNPPYINTQGIPELSREVHYEPRLAYDGGRDGLFYYRRIINEAPAYLQDSAFLSLEIGDNQAGAVKEILVQSGRFLLVKVVRDYNDVERVIVAQKVNSHG